jgi:hypothetical protein
MLEDFANKKWITLFRRSLSKNASGHALSLDWMLRGQFQDGLVCLLDSDAYPVVDDWIVTLHDQMRAASAQAIGFAHFRDESLIHPSCMLFDLRSYVSCGKPSFAMQTAGVFNDTGMVVCRQMLASGMKLLPIHKDTMERLVLHRWCATRIERMTGDFLDGVIPRAQLEKEDVAWFADPIVVATLQHT